MIALFDSERFQKLDFTDAEITDFFNYSNDLSIYGDFAVGDIPHFILSFRNIPDKPADMKKEYFIGERIINIKISEGGLYNVWLSLNNGKTLEFSCKHINQTLEMYKGKSYKNVYHEWEKYVDKVAYVESAVYFKDEDVIELPEGYSLNVKTYTDRDDNKCSAVLNVCELTQNGNRVYTYRSTYDHPCVYKGLVYHCNGHKYLPFQVDLYGISYLDLDSGEVFNYIPEGCEHDIDQYCGESFIITDIHYDPQSNLIAYGGCYWACPYEVMVGDLSDPLNFDPHLISIYDLIVSENGEGSDVDFVRFDDGKLIVKTDDNNERAFCLNELKAKLRTPFK